MSDGPSIDLLLVEDGGWLVGFAAEAIAELRPLAEAPGAGARRLATLLGASADNPPTDRGRCLVLRHSAGEAVVLAERALGTQRVPLRDLQPLPRVLRNFGAASWWLGTWLWQGRLVLLVDPHAAMVPPTPSVHP